MNQHICKAKEIDTGEWIYGYYLIASYYLDDTVKHIIFTSDTEIYPRNEFIGWYEVDPNTVCRYTGFNDKYNMPIFENDLIEYNNCIKLVSWDEYCGMFVTTSNGLSDPLYENVDTKNATLVGTKFDLKNRGVYNE